MPPFFLQNIRSAFGEPGTGVHAPRLFGVAAVDLLLTALAALLVAVAFNWRKLPPVSALFATRAAVLAVLFAGVMFAINMLQTEATVVVVPALYRQERASSPAAAAFFASDGAAASIATTFAAAFAALMVVAVATHWLFGVKTALNTALGLGRRRQQ